MDGKIPYISDIGADILKPLFVAGCAITAIGFFLSLLWKGGSDILEGQYVSSLYV